MRATNKPATLNEMLGKGMEGKTMLRVEDLPKILGEKMPSLSYDPVGRLRLVTALQGRYGVNFRQHKMLHDFLADFDKEIEVRKVVNKNKESQRG